MNKQALQQALLGLAAFQRARHEPIDLMQQVADLLQDQIGHKLFTVLMICADRRDTVRVYSDNLTAYPVNRLKRMGVTPWGDRVIHGCESWIGIQDDDIRWAFPDHALIRSLGLSSALSVPVVYAGHCVAVLNLQHEAGWYRAEHLTSAQVVSPFVIPEILRLQASMAALLPNIADCAGSAN